jgi:hypothetical protein
LCISAIATIWFFFISFFERYKLSVLSGLAITVLFIALGGLLSWYKNIQHDKNWFGKRHKNENALIVTLIENPVEKTRDGSNIDDEINCHVITIHFSTVGKQLRRSGCEVE